MVTVRLTNEEFERLSSIERVIYLSNIDKQENEQIIQEQLIELQQFDVEIQERDNKIQQQVDELKKRDAEIERLNSLLYPE